MRASVLLATLLALVLAAPAAAQVVNDSLFRVLTIHTPPEIARADTINGQQVDWGAQPPPEGITGRLVPARDTSGADFGCTALTNAADVAGQIALIRRGVCSFEQKAYWAEDAGAVAFVVYQDNRVPDGDCSSVIMAGGGGEWDAFIPGAFLPRCIAVAIVPTVASGVEVTATMAPLLVDVGTEEGAEPGGAVLGRPVPNPASGESALTLSLARAAVVRAEAFDALGRRVAVLHDGPLPAGVRRLALDASALAPGVYVVRVVVEGQVATQRVVVRR